MLAASAVETKKPARPKRGAGFAGYVLDNRQGFHASQAMAYCG